MKDEKKTNEGAVYSKFQNKYTLSSPGRFGFLSEPKCRCNERLYKKITAIGQLIEIVFS